MSDFIAKDVSIKLKRDLGIFQGKIVRAEQNSITITNAFHNGMKMKKFTAEVTIGKDEIEELKFVKVADPTEVARSVQNTPSASSNSTKNLMVLPKSDNNHMSSKSLPNFTNKSPFIKPVKPVDNRQKTTKPITILKRPTASTSNNALSSSSSGPQPLIKQDNNGSVKKNKKRTARNYDLMQPDDFSEEDFDFEGNLALFDKKEIFKKIDNENDICTKPDLVRQIKTEGKFRHDENVLDSMLMQFRNVQLEFKPKQEYTTDEPGIIIPSIPQSLRNRIQNLACDHGHLIERQNDFLARGATELALNLLGGSRRLSPKNLHQWPRVTVICDEPYNMRQSEIGLSVARQLASHGLKVMVYVKTSSHSDKPSKELELFTATGNDFTGNIRDLTNSDLVIMSVTNMNQNSQIIRYIQNNRAPVMAIDPPATGISEISIRNAVLPILPLDDIHNTCGKLHLVNICISEKFFKDAGIKYSPIFGSKFIIPLHLKN
ncbi:CLUMA_CG019542, isoform A [Clunio marinus]|uniref:CLUMA_CG019542, isoform A n=1 Tax=Clunio marinus TaxID=568069 RepID=A0A1J1J2U1_9DIPT|nr:CLUMA_CG019542, isoform A [Clunio marinus]